MTAYVIFINGIQPIPFQEGGARYMLEQFSMFIVTTVITTVITVLIEKLVNHWFDDKDDN